MHINITLAKSHVRTYAAPVEHVPGKSTIMLVNPSYDQTLPQPASPPGVHPGHCESTAVAIF